MTEPDYVTLIPAKTKGSVQVVVMTWDGRVQEHTISRTSPEFTNQTVAESLANCWAAALGVDVK